MIFILLSLMVYHYSSSIQLFHFCQKSYLYLFFSQITNSPKKSFHQNQCIFLYHAWAPTDIDQYIFMNFHRHKYMFLNHGTHHLSITLYKNRHWHNLSLHTLQKNCLKSFLYTQNHQIFDKCLNPIWLHYWNDLKIKIVNQMSIYPYHVEYHRPIRPHNDIILKDLVVPHDLLLFHF